MTVVTVVAAFVVMEPVTYAVHRWVMHGAGWCLHRSHHAARAARLEANDAFPVVFAGITLVAMLAGFSRWPTLVAVTAGVTLYGVAYGLVHDVYIHGRLGGRRRVGALERLREAHALHHRFGGEPYGMLLPVVPAAVRLRAASSAKVSREAEAEADVGNRSRSGT